MTWEKLWPTALMQAAITAAAMGIDYLINVVIFPNADYTPWVTFGICQVVGLPATYYNVSLRIDAQRARRALAASQAERDDALARLELALEDAEAASRAKSTFLATMSHEIRTPLNGVLGMAEAMAAGPLAAEQRERLAVVRQCGQAVLAQLGDVLDLSKIEAGRLELEEIEFDLGLVVDGAAGAFAALARAKGLDFIVDIGAARGVYRGDPTRLRQVLYNLISNALKFTETGAISLRAQPAGAGLRFTVRDTGIGLDRAAIDQLFTPFTQADTSTARRFGGAGLGLAICRELVRMMGGTIMVESAPGQGTAFIVELPLAAVAEPALAPPGVVAADLGPLRILAADDNPTNRLVIKALLGQAGIEVAVVEDGRAALAAWKAGRYDVVLMDVRMPVMDGLAATRAIRRAEADQRRPRTPIIALTADVMADHLADYQAAGMDAYVPKPVEAARLFETIESLLVPSEAASDAA